MGSSSRPLDFKYNEFNEHNCENYFNYYFEKWRVQIDDLRDFYLAGHSFGGYLVCNYASKYPFYIKKLILLSPIGLNQKS